MLEQTGKRLVPGRIGERFDGTKQARGTYECATCLQLVQHREQPCLIAIGHRYLSLVIDSFPFRVARAAKIGSAE